MVAFDRGEPPTELLEAWSAQPGKVIPTQGDICEQDTLDAAFRKIGIDAAIHAATVTSNAERDAECPESVLGTNIIGTVNTLKAFRKTEAGRFIFVGSTSVYGPNALSWPYLNEDETVCDPRSLYGISKFAAERTALRLGALWNLDVRVARLSSVFGPWERNTGVRDTLNPMLQVTLAALRSKEAILERPCRRDWIYNRDVASGLLELVRSPRLQHLTYHVAPGIDRSWTVEEWCRRLQQAFPGFRYRIAGEGDVPNINLHEPDRAPLNHTRIFTDTDFRPAYDFEQAFEDLLQWAEKYPAVWDKTLL